MIHFLLILILLGIVGLLLPVILRSLLIFASIAAVFFAVLIAAGYMEYLAQPKADHEALDKAATAVQKSLKRQDDEAWGKVVETVKQNKNNPYYAEAYAKVAEIEARKLETDRKRQEQ